MTVLAATADAAGLDGIAGCAVLATAFIAGRIRKARSKVNA
ncbi:hypothetical protein [Arthrobacter sp. K5]|uniref:Uncharacterized protein n=1 Tax=Arthrobacter sp. K5 TaxID=2839623 RepID=A0AAU8ESM4_9MICC